MYSNMMDFALQHARQTHFTIKISIFARNVVLDVLVAPIDSIAQVLVSILVTTKSSITAFPLQPSPVHSVIHRRHSFTQARAIP
jgi:hypothetical protein